MNRQNILLGILILLIIGGGWWYFMSGDDEGAATDGTQQTSANTELRQRLQRLQRIKNISLDTTVLEDPAFQALSEPNLPPEQPVTLGRSNPFLPF